MTNSPLATYQSDQRALALIGGEATDANLRRYLHGIPGIDAVGLEAGCRSEIGGSKNWSVRSHKVSSVS